MKKFAVVSYGYSASRWLSYTLALNESVFVAHGTYAVDSILSGSDEYERHREENGERLDSLTIGRKELRFKSMPIKELYSLYQNAFPGLAAYGNVHTYVPRELFYKKDWEALDLSVFHLIRHPIAFLHSHSIGVLQAEAVPELNRHYAHFFDLFKQRFPHVTSEAWFNAKDRQQRAFILSCYTLFNLAQDLRRYGNKMHSIKMEALTSNPSTLKRFCEQATGCVYTIEKLKKWLEKGAVNKHQSQPRDLNLTAHQKKILQSVLPRELYQYILELGYELPLLNHVLDTFD